MSNISNYIQATETIQSFSQQPKKYWQYVYELRHIPTGKLYVGSRSNQSTLKKFEDCYTDKYLGSSSLKEGPFSKKDTKENPQDYAKTVLRVFYDEDAKKASRYEHGSNGLIMTYWTMYGKDKVLNGHCVLNDGSKVWSTAGQNNFANKTPEELETIRQKQRVANIKTWGNKSEVEKAEWIQKNSGENSPRFGKNAFDNKSEEELEDIAQKKSVAIKKAWQNKTHEQLEDLKKKHSGEKNGTKTMFQHPYNNNLIGNCFDIRNDIKKNWPNKPQWNQIPYKKKNKLKIKDTKNV